MEHSEAMAQLVCWLYRANAYLLANVVEDPAWLAFVFC